MNLKIKNTTGITLNGNLLSGNTYPVKEYIKAYLGGKWDSNSKAWTVDVEKVNDLIERGGYVKIDDSSETSKTSAMPANWYHYTRSGERELNEDY